MKRLIVILIVLATLVSGVYYGNEILVDYRTKEAVADAREFNSTALAWKVRRVSVVEDGLILKVSPLLRRSRSVIHGDGISVSIPHLLPVKWVYRVDINTNHTHFDKYQAFNEGDTISFVIRYPKKVDGWESFLKPIRY